MKLRTWLGQLRHAYKNAVDKAIGDQVSFANHLLAPAIAEAEKFVTDTDEELDKLREENAQLRLRIANLDSDHIKERNSLKEQVADLKEIEEVARRFYKTVSHTMAAFTKNGLALKGVLGEQE